MEGTQEVAEGLWIWRLSYPDWHETAGWPEVVTSTCVAFPDGVSVHVVHVLLRLNLPARPAATILCGRSTSMKVMSPHPKRSSGASILKRAPAPRPTESTRVSRHSLR